MQSPIENSDIVCAFSNRHSQNLSLAYGDTTNSLDNRKVFLGLLGIDYRDLVCAKQVHGAHVEYVVEKDRGRGALRDLDAVADTDAFITDKKNVPLAIFTADCLSVFLYEPKQKVIGLVHAGWRSTKEEILLKTIKLMQENFGINTESLLVGFGPAIRICCYKVGKEFDALFIDGIIEKDGQRYLDLARINLGQLQSIGVAKNNIFDSQICTHCETKDFFSYRKEGSSCGRIMSVIMLKEKS